MSLTILEPLFPAWKRHFKSWKDCRECPLGCRATKHVMARGRIPADVLLIGEAPGESEDACGEPFMGKAGEVLDNLLDDLKAKFTFSFCIGNILACIPRPDPVYNDDVTKKFRKPRKHEIKACIPRLVELTELVNPRGIIYLGEVAEKNAPLPPDGTAVIHVYHPSYILRNGGKSSLAYKRTRLKLENFLKELLANSVS